MEEALQFFCDKIIWGLPVVVFIVLSGVVFGIRLRGRFFAGPKKLKAAFRAQSTDGLRPIDAFTLTTGGKIGIGTPIVAFCAGPIMEFCFRLVHFDATQVRHQHITTTLHILISGKK